MFSIGTGGGKLLGTTGNLDMLEKIDPAILVGMPTFLYHLLRQGAEEGRQFPDLRCGVRRRKSRRELAELAKLAKAMGADNVTTLATYGYPRPKWRSRNVLPPSGKSPLATTSSPTSGSSK